MWEPWHIRWIGEDAAKQVKESGWTLTEYFQKNLPLNPPDANQEPGIPAGG